MAARVTSKDGADALSIYPEQLPVQETTAGTVYSARALGRSEAAGRLVCVRVREWSPGVVVGSASSC